MWSKAASAPSSLPARQVNLGRLLGPGPPFSPFIAHPSGMPTWKGDSKTLRTTAEAGTTKGACPAQAPLLIVTEPVPAQRYMRGGGSVALFTAPWCSCSGDTVSRPVRSDSMAPVAALAAAIVVK